MNPPESIAEITAIGSFLLNVVIAIVGFTWGLSKLTLAVETKLAVSRQKVVEEISDARTALFNEIEMSRRETGEAVTAIRTKVHELELFTRDTFVRRDNFYQVMDSTRNESNAQFNKIDVRLERLQGTFDEKLEALNDRFDRARHGDHSIR